MGKTQRSIKLNLDLSAAAEGFGSAQAPTPAHHRIAKHYSSPLLMGPPPSRDLLELVLHMFTDEEAQLAQHLPPLWPRSAEQVARRAGRPAHEVRRVLDHLALTKAVLLATGRHVRRYTILPVVPGTFEMALMTADLRTRNSWHQRFSEIFERLYGSGYLLDYVRSQRPTVRALPAAALGAQLTGAWPAEQLEQILEPYQRFAIGNCQCRLAMHLVHKGCHRPLMNCVAIGPMAKPVIARGMMKSASRQAVLDVKREAEAAGCLTWIGNTHGGWRGNISCSCCGCCCHALRAVTEFNTPGLICPPHFLPTRNDTLCKGCPLCVEACPLGAWTAQGKGQAPRFEQARCVGCGLCVVACKRGALSMQPVPRPHALERGWPALVAKELPGYLTGAVKVWAARLFGGTSKY